jgi:hypothetical protein
MRLAGYDGAIGISQVKCRPQDLAALLATGDGVLGVAVNFLRIKSNGQIFAP